MEYKDRKGHERMGRRTEAVARFLPYGVWRTTMDRLVLFDRDYAPICDRLPGLCAAMADPHEFVKNIAEEIWFYNDGTPAAERKSRCLKVLREWDMEKLVMADIDVRLRSPAQVRAWANWAKAKVDANPRPLALPEIEVEIVGGVTRTPAELRAWLLATLTAEELLL